MSGILSMLSGGTYSTKPDAPTIGTATATSTTTATVAFTAPAKDGGVSISSYTATSSPGSITGTLSQAGSGTITVSGLTTGTAYTFTVTATNSVGTSDASSASNSITTYLAPANTVAPVISGTATVGQTLSSTTGTWDGVPTPTFGYQWQRSGSNIGGATSSTYTLVEADYANTIRCAVTATNVVSAVSANSNATASVAGNAPVNTVAPSVSGTATRGQTLSSTTGTWTGVPTPTFGYQWQRSGSNIGGATSSTYTLVSADVGNTIRCVVTATNAVSAVAANSNATGSVAAQVPGAPTSVSATATAYNTATVSFSAPADNGGSSITNYSVSGGGSGSSGSSPIYVTGLSGETSYTFTVTASNSAGAGPASAASNSITTSAAPPTVIGQAYGGGYYAGSISTAGNGTASHYLIVGPRASTDSRGTGPSGGKRYKNPYNQHTLDDPGATSAIDGLANSNSINNANHEAAQFCRSRTAGGYTDWYLPATNELDVVYFNLRPNQNVPNDTGGLSGINPNAVPRRDVNYTTSNPPRTSATDFQAINAESYSSSFTWASTQLSSSTARGINFYNGYQFNMYKYFNGFTRAIRKVAV